MRAGHALPTALCLLALAACGGRKGAEPLFNPRTPPDTAEARQVDAARLLYEQGLYDRARASLDALLNAGCAHPEALLLRARLAAQAGDHAGALPWCDRAIAASPFWTEPRVLLAQLHLKLERPAAAEAVFVDIERLDPKGPWGPWGQGMVAQLRGDQARARILLDRALEREPDHRPALEARARLAALAGEAEREQALLRRLTARRGEDAGTLARLAELARQQGRHEDARRDYERSWELEPQPATARALAELAASRGDEDAAVRWRARGGLGAAEPQPGQAEGR